MVGFLRYGHAILLIIHVNKSILRLTVRMFERYMCGMRELSENGIIEKFFSTL
jgi:hypothetical protein